MLNKIYLIGGGTLIAAYLGWSFFGVELMASRMESVPTTKVTSTRSGSRTSGGYYRTGGYGFGK